MPLDPASPSAIPRAPSAACRGILSRHSS